MCKKSTKNDKSSTLGRSKDALGDFLGRVGGRGGRLGNLVLGIYMRSFENWV